MEEAALDMSLRQLAILAAVEEDMTVVGELVDGGNVASGVEAENEYMEDMDRTAGEAYQYCGIGGAFAVVGDRNWGCTDSHMDCTCAAQDLKDKVADCGCCDGGSGSGYTASSCPYLAA